MQSFDMEIKVAAAAVAARPATETGHRKLFWKENKSTTRRAEMCSVEGNGINK